MKLITRTVWILSLVSFFTDVASEMLYPVMPLYLKEIGFSILLIGILEGVAEATAGLSKSYFGKLSDGSGKRLPFVRLGYLFSALSKPMMVAFIFPMWVFMARTLDRLGKGIRTGARDAMLSDEATMETKGRVFGLHRAMDTLGAVVGPLLALLFLYANPQQYKVLFLIAFIPGVVAISFTFLLKEKNKHNRKVVFTDASVLAFARYWKESPHAYKRLVIGLLAFALVNSSDVFLLLKVKESGVDDTVVIGVYIFYNLIYALTAYPLGRLSDRIGFKKTFLIGLTLFSLVYAGMAFGTTLVHFLILFTIYGLFAAATESVAKAWISNISDKRDTATAIGTYTGFQSVFTMMASIIAGWLWMAHGANAVFLLTSFFTALVILYFIIGGANVKSVTD